MTTLQDVMTSDPLALPAHTPVREAARNMKERDIGAVVVTDGDQTRGIVTDRDIVVRAIAEGRDPESTPLGEICSEDLVALSPGDDVDQAAQLMREKDLRRLPVVEGGKPVGIVSLGDLAVEKDPDSAVADISAAPPNN